MRRRMGSAVLTRGLLRSNESPRVVFAGKRGDFFVFTSSFLQTPFRGNQHETIISDRYRCRGFGLANGGRRTADYSQLIWGSASSLSFEDANGDAALAAYSEIIHRGPAPRRHGGPSPDHFGAGNVSKILTSGFRRLQLGPAGLERRVRPGQALCTRAGTWILPDAPPAWSTWKRT